MITSTGNPIAGETYSLDCSVTGASDPATYQWFHSNGTLLTNINQLQFSPLLASQAGTYTCRATVGSVVVENSNTVGVTCKFLCYIHIIFSSLLSHLSSSSYCCDCHSSSRCHYCRIQVTQPDLHRGAESSSGCSSDCEHNVEWARRNIYAS